MNKKYINYVWIGGIVLVAVLLGVKSLGVIMDNKTILSDSFDKLITARTYHVKANLDLNLGLNQEGSSRKAFNNASVQVEGDIAHNEDSVPELSGRLYMASRGRGNVLFVDGDARILSDQVAFKLDNLPSLMDNSEALVDKWTYVDAPLLTTKNKEAVKETFRLVLADMEYLGKEKMEGDDAHHFSGSVSPENKEKLIAVTDKDSSGNSALHIITRLLRNNEVKALDIWVDESSKELSLIRVQFSQSLEDEVKDDFAVLELAFSDYGKKVAIDRPAKELSVKPGVFSKFFGEGKTELRAANDK